MPDVSREVSAPPLVFQPRRHAVRVRVYALRGAAQCAVGTWKRGYPTLPRGRSRKRGGTPGGRALWEGRGDGADSGRLSTPVRADTAASSPTICGWTPRSSPCLGCCKWRCVWKSGEPTENVRSGRTMDSGFSFLLLHSYLSFIYLFIHSCIYLFVCLRDPMSRKITGEGNGNLGCPEIFEVTIFIRSTRLSCGLAYAGRGPVG